MSFVRILFGAIKGARRLLFVALLSASLIFNAIFLFWEVGAVAVKGIFATVLVASMVSGKVTSLKKDKVKLQRNIAELAKEKQSLITQNARLRGRGDAALRAKGEMAKKLAISEERFAVTGAKLSAVRGNLEASEKARNVALSQIKSLHENQAKRASAFRKLHEKVKGRLLKVAGANVFAVIAEAAPFAGAAVVVVVSILELREHCKMAVELNEMARLLKLEISKAEENEICGMKVPKLGLSDKKIEKITKEWKKLFDN
jgi:Skp family chaperone for outer membrane proteins